MQQINPYKYVSSCFTFVFGLFNCLNAQDVIDKTISAVHPIFDVCNLNHIYNTDYQYSLPQKVLENFLSGKAFDNPNLYTDEELHRLKEDANDIYQSIISANPTKENLAIITAGAPGAGKTMKLRQDLEAKVSEHKFYAYICPDDVCLKNQEKTYRKEIESSDKSAANWQKAYNIWRPGSNAITHLILGNLIREKYAFYFGSTSTGPATGKFFEFLKTQDYKIRLLHISASDDVRWGSVKERNKTFVQTTEQDVKEKGLLLPQRINDTYLKYADEIEFYYRDDVHQDAKIAARWLRNSDSTKPLGSLQILDPEKYEKIKCIHNEAAKVLDRPDIYWESSVEQVSQII